MRSPRRIPFSLRATIFALAIFRFIAMSKPAMGQDFLWQPALTPASSAKTRGPVGQIRPTPLRFVMQTAGAATAPPATPVPARPAEDPWNDAAGSLAAKIMEQVNPGIALALSIKNTSSLDDGEVFRIRRALRTQLRNHRVRFATGKQAKVDVQVTLSENSEGYVWIAEIRDRPAAGVPSEDVRDAVVMVPVGRPSLDDRHSAAEPLSIRKARIYEQTAPMLDVLTLESAPAAVGDARASSAARILVLSLDGISLYERADATESANKNIPQWRLKQTAALERVRTWPRDARGRIVVRGEGLFDAYLPGTKCSGALEPTLTLECHESDDPWPLNAVDRGANGAPSSAPTETGPAAYFAPERNYFDGRIKLDEGREVKAFPFLSLVLMPPKAAAHAGLPAPAGRVPPTATDVPGWVLSGLDGRTQLLNSNLQPVANVGGWGSQIVGLQTGCGAGWQVLASQARDLGQPDAIQAYEIADRKPAPVSSPVEFAGPIMELWPLANGSQAIAISRNLQTATYEAFRLSISCSD